VLFEDIDLDAHDCPNAKALAETLGAWTGRDDLKGRLAVVPNDVFSYFSETATEVTAHTALEPDTKTVKDGALWYEEALPAESLLSSFVLKDGADFSPRSPLQIGGKGSVGKGLLSVTAVPGVSRD
jgi:CRISPR-associated protein Cmr4